MPFASSIRLNHDAVRCSVKRIFFIDLVKFCIKLEIHEMLNANENEVSHEYTDCANHEKLASFS